MSNSVLGNCVGILSTDRKIDAPMGSMVGFCSKHKLAGYLDLFCRQQKKDIAFASLTVWILATSQYLRTDYIPRHMVLVEATLQAQLVGTAFLDTQFDQSRVA